MKQHITLEQFLEISEEHQNKLRDMWIPQDNDLYFTQNPQGEWENKVNPVYDDGEYSCIRFDTKEVGNYANKIGDMYPCLTIGKMIEILENKHNGKIDIDFFKEGYDVRVYEETDDCAKVFVFNSYTTELCDALWEAVKEIL